MPKVSTLSQVVSVIRSYRRGMLGGSAALAFAGVVWLGTSQPAPAQQAGQPFTTEQTQAIQKIIKDYLVSNPEVFLEIQQALESRMEAQQAEKAKVAIKENAAELYRRADAPTAGNVKGDVTIVEFFDYNCGYCKRGFGDLAKLLEKDSKIKLVLKELPILSKGSEEAAKVALAARLQGKYWEVHRALLESRAPANEAVALKLAEKTGVDMARLKKDMEGAEVKAELAKSRELAQKMGIQGTPHFLIGDKAIPGAPDNLLDTLTGMVADVRKNGCSVC